MLFIIFCLFVIIKVTDAKKYVKLVASLISIQAFKQYFREDYKLNRQSTILLLICNVLVVSVLIFSVNQRFKLILTTTYSLYQYVFIVGALTVSLFLKITINYLLAAITLKKELYKEYLYAEISFRQTLGVFLFPLVICLMLSKYPNEFFMYPGIILTFIFFMLRIFRSYMTAVMEQNVGFLYIFLYFCGLEILPLFIIVKFLLINFN